MLNRFRQKMTMVGADSALPGRDQAMRVASLNAVLGHAMKPPFPVGLERAIVGMGCFWGAEKAFWSIPGVYTTAVGYAGGFTPNPTYEEVCSGRTGHTEAVLVVFDPARTSYQEILRHFWEGHNPTQGMRQGNDVGSQYRSAIYFDTPAQQSTAIATRDAFQQLLKDRRYGEITTEIAPAGAFYYAEDYHQQYLKKNPYGYCPHHSTGVSCPIGAAAATAAAQDPAPTV